MNSTVGRWSAAWLGGTVIGVGKRRGQARHVRKPPERIHSPSSVRVTAVAAFASFFQWLEPRWPLADRREAVRVGRIWRVLTVLFEFGFGRLVAKKPWRELLADYNLLRGRTWPLVVLWVWRGPAIIQALHAGR